MVLVLIDENTPSNSHTLIVVSLEHDMNVKGLLTWVHIEYTSATWLDITDMQVPIIIVIIIMIIMIIMIIVIIIIIII